MKDLEKFKSADELHIKPEIRSYLLAVLAMFEYGEVKYDPGKHTEPNGFNLGAVVTKHDKGVCACIFGWVTVVASLEVDPGLPKIALGRVCRFFHGWDLRLIELFWGPEDKSWTLEDVTLEQAIMAIKNYLIRGDAHWEEIINGHTEGTTPKEFRS